MFWGNKCAFGQVGAAQRHLAKQNVAEGDIFLFFGLFAYEGVRDPHHRIFGYLTVEKVRSIGSRPRGDEAGITPREHPHTIGEWHETNTIYLGRGAKAKRAHDVLRLTKVESPASHWSIPQWFREATLTYHTRRWGEGGTVQAVGRGQEFVADIGNKPDSKRWLDEVITAIGKG
jgi:Nucleotide modification associated domain 3